MWYIRNVYAMIDYSLRHSNTGADPQRVLKIWPQSAKVSSLHHAQKVRLKVRRCIGCARDQFCIICSVIVPQMGS
jgi:hypothetical protein